MPLTPDDAKAATYGRLVLAAYAMFKDPQSADPLRPTPQGIPPEYEFEAWIHMSDFLLKSVVKFYGIVVREKADPNTRVVAIRGTEGRMEWIDDSLAILVPFHEAPSAGRVAFGFDRIYKTFQIVPPSAPGIAEAAAPAPLRGSLVEQLAQLASRHQAARRAAGVAAATPPRQRTAVTGHSLGGALTTLFVMENASKKLFDIDTLCTFASPRVGNSVFARTFNRLAITSWRMVNMHDLVPKIPFPIPVILDYEHVDTAYEFDSTTFAKANLLCFHQMETYLHAVDASFRVTAECK